LIIMYLKMNFRKPKRKFVMNKFRDFKPVYNSKAITILFESRFRDLLHLESPLSASSRVAANTNDIARVTHSVQRIESCRPPRKCP
jgi:hypothetical protein